MRVFVKLVLASCILLAGCNGNDGEPPITTQFSHALFGDPKEVGLKRDEAFQEQVKALVGGTRLVMTDPPLVNPRLPARLDGGATIVDMPVSRAYLRNLAEKLLGYFPPTLNAREIDVFVISGGGYEAFANEQGDIFVSARWFVDAMDPETGGEILSEDSLAFLLAHEIAHVHLNHFKDNESFLDLETLLDTVQEAISIYSQVKRSGLSGESGMTPEQRRSHRAVNRRVEASFSAIKAMQVGGLEPILWRDNELDADTLAVRVMTVAGYQPRLTNPTFNRLGEAQKKVMQDLIHQLEIVGIAIKALAELSSENKLITVVQAQGVDLSIRAALALFREWSETHPPIAQRKASSALLYRERLYKEIPGARRQMPKAVPEDIATETAKLRSVLKASDVHACLIFHKDEHKNIDDDIVLVSADGTKRVTWQEMRVAASDVEYTPDESYQAGTKPKSYKSLAEQPTPPSKRKPSASCPFSDAPLQPNDMSILAERIRGEIRSFRGERTAPGYLWYVFGAIRQAQGRLDDFHENLERGYRSAHAEPLLMREQALGAIEQDAFGIADRRISEIEETFGTVWGMDLRANVSLKQGNVVELARTLSACEDTNNRTVESRCDVVELKARQAGVTQASSSGATGQQIEQGSEKSQSLFGKIFNGLTN
ncbi:MAG: M48 family metalloprotease [Minwuia sp.]|nr:M48 family metalloprotease [Minwuia sp.]